MKKISVIVPCYNMTGIIERCVDSLLNQTLEKQDLEIILVDDCSTDDTYQILLEYEAGNPNVIKVYQTPENMRQGGARNIGLREACGEYIGFVDADDWVEPEMYETLYGIAKQYDCDLVRCRQSRDQTYRMLAPEEKATGQQDQLIDLVTDADRSELIASDYLGHGLLDRIFRRSFLVDNKIDMPEHCAYEDLYFAALVQLYLKRFCVHEMILYHYYVNPMSTTLAIDRPYQDDFFRVHDLMYEELTERGAFDAYPEAMQFDVLMNYFMAGVKHLALRYSKPQYERYRELIANTIARGGALQIESEYANRFCDEFQKLSFSLLKNSISDQEIESLYRLTGRYYQNAKQ